MKFSLVSDAVRWFSTMYPDDMCQQERCKALVKHIVGHNLASDEIEAIIRTFHSRAEVVEPLEKIAPVVDKHSPWLENGSVETPQFAGTILRSKAEPDNAVFRSSNDGFYHVDVLEEHGFVKLSVDGRAAWIAKTLQPYHNLDTNTGTGANVMLFASDKAKRRLSQLAATNPVAQRGWYPLPWALNWTLVARPEPRFTVSFDAVPGLAFEIVGARLRGREVVMFEPSDWLL